MKNRFDSAVQMGTPNPRALRQTSEKKLTEAIVNRNGSSVIKDADTDFERLLTELGPEMLKEVLDQIHIDAPQLLQQAKDNWDRQDISAFNAALHTLKGAATTLGLKELGAQVQGTRSLQSGDDAPTAQLVQLAEDSVAAARAFL